MDHVAAKSRMRGKGRPTTRPRQKVTLAVAGLMIVLLTGLLGACRVTSVPAGTAPVTPSLQWIDDLALLPPGPVERLEVAYFHHTVRCDSCIEAERLTRKTLDTYFTAEMESGLVALVTADVDSGEDAALVQRYAAAGPSLYLGISKGAALYIYPVDFWNSLGDESQFLVLLRGMIDQVLAGQ